MNNKTDEYYRQLVLDSVDFGRENYLNARWIGCFGQKKNVRITAVINYFIDYFYDYIHKFTIASSLFIDTDHSKRILDIEQELCADNYIKTISLGTYVRENLDLCYNLDMQFSIKQSSENSVRKLSFLRMSNSNTLGQLFFILEDLELIISPTRGGYEFFGIKSRNNKTAMEFFEKTHRKKEFFGTYRAVNNKLKNFPPFQAYLWKSDDCLT
jgi:hypothetical protein